MRLTALTETSFAVESEPPQLSPGGKSSCAKVSPADPNLDAFSAAANATGRNPLWLERDAMPDGFGCEPLVPRSAARPKHGPPRRERPVEARRRRGVCLSIRLVLAEARYRLLRQDTRFLRPRGHSRTGTLMHVGQKVRVKPSSVVAREWHIPRGAEGTILCRYRLLKGGESAPARVDVKFEPELMVWGAPDVDFEPIPASREGRQHR